MVIKKKNKKNVSLEQEKEISEKFFEEAKEKWIADKSEENRIYLAMAIARINKLDLEILSKRNNQLKSLLDNLKK